MFNVLEFLGCLKLFSKLFPIIVIKYLFGLPAVLLFI